MPLFGTNRLEVGGRRQEEEKTNSIWSIASGLQPPVSSLQRDIYPEAYERDYGFLRPIIPEVVEKFMGCGDFANGFARVRCDHCKHEPIWAGAR